MASYKSVRLEEEVYQEVQRRQWPQESMSETVARVMRTLDKVRELIRSAVDGLQEGEHWPQ